MIYNSNENRVSPYDSKKLAVNSTLRPEVVFMKNWGRNWKKTVYFDDMVHVIEEENIVTFVVFDCRINFYPEASINVKPIKPRNAKPFPFPVKNPSASQETINLTVL